MRVKQTWRERSAMLQNAYQCSVQKRISTLKLGLLKGGCVCVCVCLRPRACVSWYRVPHKYSKINKFTKSPSSVGGVPKFRFLTHMAVIKNQKSALEMARGRVSKISSIRKCKVGDIESTMEANHGHNSCCRAFPKVRIWHNDTKHVSKVLVRPRGAHLFFE